MLKFLKYVFYPLFYLKIKPAYAISVQLAR